MTSLTRQFIEENESCAVRIVERSARCDADEWKEWFEYCLVKKKPKMLDAILARGFPVNTTFRNGEHGLFLLAQLCFPMEKSLECLQVLLRYGVDPDPVDKNGWTPLVAFVADMSYECVKLLLVHGASPNAPTSPTPPIFFAIGIRRANAVDVRVLEVLLKFKADVDVVCRGKTLWEEAVDIGHPNVLRCLIRHGFDVNARCFEHGTMLHLAAKRDTNATATLLEFGANPNALDEKGRTPLHIACESQGPKEYHAYEDYYYLKHDRIAELIRRGADPRIRNKDGRTPRDCLCAHSRETFEECMKKYADRFEWDKRRPILSLME
jgi:ankyrin repeat protein